jgi:hypothetical protein
MSHLDVDLAHDAHLQIIVKHISKVAMGYASFGGCSLLRQFFLLRMEFF